MILAVKTSNDILKRVTMHKPRTSRNQNENLSGSEFLVSNINLTLSLPVAIGLLMAGCVTVPESTTTERKPADVEERVIVNGTVLPLPEEPTIRAESLPGSAKSSPVVAGLMSSAESHQRAGNLDRAANALERALRIEPRNAQLWNRLADIRYAQKNWQQSVQMAAKSNTLAGQDTGLRRRNWYLMVNAYEELGDTERADKYRQKLLQ